VKQVIWLLVILALGAGAYWVWNARRRWLEHRRTAEERTQAFMAEIYSRKSPSSPTARDKADPD
jgi:hypothetical protein